MKAVKVMKRKPKKNRLFDTLLTFVGLCVYGYDWI